MMYHRRHLPLLQVDELAGAALEPAAEPTLVSTGWWASAGGPAGLSLKLSPWIPRWWASLLVRTPL